MTPARKSAGRVAFVGSGPGDPGLITANAQELLAKADLIVTDPDVPSARANASLRAPWFEVSCCPPNVARTLASLPAYLATASDEGLQLHQYAGASIRTVLPDGERVEVDVETDYPRSGVIRVGEEEIPLEPGRFVLVSPDETRQVVAGPEGLAYVVVGAVVNS